MTDKKRLENLKKIIMKLDEFYQGSPTGVQGSIRRLINQAKTAFRENIECPKCKNIMNVINIDENSLQCPACYLIHENKKYYRVSCDDYHRHSKRCLAETTAKEKYL